MFCTDISEPMYFIFSSAGFGLTYYSHIPAVLSAIFIGILVYIKNPKNLVNKILFLLCLSFVVWVFSSLTSWVGVDSRFINYFWVVLALSFVLISFFSFYFLYVFIKKKDLPFKIKILWLLISLPVLILAPTNLNITGFDIAYCQPTENSLFSYYYYFIGLFSLISILFIAITSYKNVPKSFKRQLVLVTTGIGSFLLSFFFSSFMASFLVYKGIFNSYGIEQYGLFGMIVFMSFLAFLIVRFKAFNIKLLGSQVLVISLVIIIGSEFLFIENNINRILVSFTLVISAIIGLILIRSVKKVDQQRELLEISNNEQENLIHFISHQVKGFFTKSRNIFATLNDEKTDIDPKLFKYIEEGLRSDDEGINLVESILNAANFKTGKVELVKKKFSLSGLLKKVYDINKPVAEKKNLKFHLNLATKDVLFVGDEFRIEDALNNIVQNAIKYTENGGVHISLVEDSSRGILITIKDTGIGLSDKDKSKLFSSGGRGEESLKYNVNSTGYGLYIAKKIINGHHGSIRAKSEGRGKGSVFTIILPIK